MSGFPGFPRETLEFLRGLQANNTRDWFNEHKSAYETGFKVPAAHFSETMAGELEDLTGLPHSSKLFRIHRDLRFSKDKTPYKSHMHMLFRPAGVKDPPAWFFGLEPERLHLGAGMFGFEKPALEAFRHRVVSDANLGETIDALREDGIRLNEPALKRVPSGFPANHPRADLLRHKGLHGWIDLDDPEVVLTPQVTELCRTGFTRLRSLFDLLMPAPA